MQLRESTFVELIWNNHEMRVDGSDVIQISFECVKRN